MKIRKDNFLTQKMKFQIKMKKKKIWKQMKKNKKNQKNNSEQKWVKY